MKSLKNLENGPRALSICFCVLVPVLLEAINHVTQKIVVVTRFKLRSVRAEEEEEEEEEDVKFVVLLYLAERRTSNNEKKG